MKSGASSVFPPVFFTSLSGFIYRCIACLLQPLASVFTLLACRRRQRLSACQVSVSLPIIVVGNISVGGTGKTPLLIALAHRLQADGWRVAVISRGYGGSQQHKSYWLSAEDSAEVVGDEPYLIHQTLGCPVVVGADRVASVRSIESKQAADVILSDDGLQHYALPRHIELAVIDGARGLGNARCLPAGPLREAPARLQQVDIVVVNGEPNLSIQKQLQPWLAPNSDLPHSSSSQLPNWLTGQQAQPSDVSPLPVVGVSSLAACGWYSVKTNQPVDVTALHHNLNHDSCLVVAGIGFPQRFFNSVAEQGIVAEHKAYPDHFDYSADKVRDWADRTVLMTAKDAVKCRPFAQDNWFYLAVAAQLPEHCYGALLQLLATTKTAKDSSARIN